MAQKASKKVLNEVTSTEVNEGFNKGYLYDKFGRTEFKQFLDGLGTRVNDVPSPPHGSHQWSDGVTLGHRTNTHLRGEGGVVKYIELYTAEPLIKVTKEEDTLSSQRFILIPITTFYVTSEERATSL